MQNLLLYGAASATLAIATLTQGAMLTESLIRQNDLQNIASLVLPNLTTNTPDTTNNALLPWQFTSPATTSATAMVVTNASSNHNNNSFSLAQSSIVDEGGGHNSIVVPTFIDNLIHAVSTTAAMISTNINSSIERNGTALNGSGMAAATETPFVPYVMRPETYIVPVLFAFIFIVGVLGNGTLIVVFLSVRQMRNVPNTYILSLAIADLLVICTTVPLTSIIYTLDSWPWGSFLCTLSEFIKDVSIGVSVFTLTALSGDRYFAIVDPLRKFHAHGGGKSATRLTIAIALSIWLWSFLCALPALLGTNVKNIEINKNKSFAVCYPFPDKWGVEYAKIMVMVRFLLYYAIPLVIIGAFYVLIAWHLMYAANVPGEMQGAVRQVRARRKVAMTVLAFVVIFGLCFLPYHIFFLWFYYWPTSQEDYNSFWHVLRIVGFCLSFANSCANPVALYFVSGAFRKHFNRSYPLKRKKIVSLNSFEAQKEDRSQRRRYFHRDFFLFLEGHFSVGANANNDSSSSAELQNTPGDTTPEQQQTSKRKLNMIFDRYLFCQGSATRHKKRHPHNDTMCMHRDTSLTSTASKRYYSSTRRSTCHHQSTIRSRLQETTVTMMANGNNNGGPLTDISDVALASEFCEHSPHPYQQQQLQPNHQHQQQQPFRQMSLM